MMATSPDVSTKPPGLVALPPVQLADISPDNTLNGEITAIVTLLWPFSISHQTLSVLIAEHDWRLRDKRGQLKVTFLGEAAVQLKDIQIGNVVRLSIEGARWQAVPNASPKEVPWTLEWERRLRIKVLDDGVLVTDIDESFAPATISHTLEVIEASQSLPDIRPLTPPALHNQSTNEPFWSPPFPFGSFRSLWGSQNRSMMVEDDQLEDAEPHNESSIFEQRSHSFRYLGASTSPERVTNASPDGVFESMLPDELTRPDGVPVNTKSVDAYTYDSLAFAESSPRTVSDVEIYEPLGPELSDLQEGFLQDVSQDSSQQPSHAILLDDSALNPEQDLLERQDALQTLSSQLASSQDVPEADLSPGAPQDNLPFDLLSNFTISDFIPSKDNINTPRNEPVTDATILREASDAMDRMIDVDEESTPMEDIVPSFSPPDERRMSQAYALRDRPAFGVESGTVDRLMREASAGVDNSIHSEMSPPIVTEALPSPQVPGQVHLKLFDENENIFDHSTVQAKPNLDALFGKSLLATPTPLPMQSYFPSSPLPVQPDYQCLLQRSSVGFTFGPRTDIVEQTPKPAPLKSSKRARRPPEPSHETSPPRSPIKRFKKADKRLQPFSDPLMEEIPKEDQEIHSPEAAPSMLRRHVVPGLPHETEDYQSRTPLPPVGLYLPERTVASERPPDIGRQSPKTNRRKSVGTIGDGADKSGSRTDTILKQPAISIALPPFLGRPTRTPATAVKASQPRSALSVVRHGRTPSGVVNTTREPEKTTTKKPSDTQLTQKDQIETTQSIEEKYAELSRKLKKHVEEANFAIGITTPLSDFPAISKFFPGVTTDMLAINIRVSKIERARSGPQDYYTVLRVIDPSSPLGMRVSIFRPYKEALPRSKPGDVLLLRSFKISSDRHQFVATSTNSSAWAIWRHKDDMEVEEILESEKKRLAKLKVGKSDVPPAHHSSLFSKSARKLPQSDEGEEDEEAEEPNQEKKRVLIKGRGPEVEFGDEEEDYVEKLGEWWDTMNDELHKDLRKGPGQEDPDEIRPPRKGKRTQSVDIEDSLKRRPTVT